MTNREHRRASKPLRLTYDELCAINARDTNAHLVGYLVETFGGEDAAGAIADTIEGARARDTTSAAPLVMLADYYPSLGRAPIPMRVDLRALRRCVLLAYGGDEAAQHYASTMN